jgi:ABC-2 type transport system ATP-binding protein
VTIAVADPQAAVAEIKERFGHEATSIDGTVRFHVPAGSTFLPRFVQGFAQPLESITLQRPTLDDVFITLTGREMRDEELDAKAQLLAEGARWRRQR